MKARIQRLSLPEGRRILAVSDVHGNLEYLRGVLSAAGFSPKDILFIVGDLLEKGENSLKTLRYVISLSKTHEVYAVSGNCDWWYPILYSDELLSSQNTLWYVNNKPYNLARQMCAEIGYPVSMDMDVRDMRDTLAAAFPEEFAFLRAMPEVIETERFTFVHGGLPGGEPETWDAWKCMKHDAFLSEGRSFDKYVICGHWPVMLYHESYVDANPIIDKSRRIVSIDGGCVLKDDGQLNALVIPDACSDDFSFFAYDRFPVRRALHRQAASEKSYYIRWGDNEVELLERGAEFSRCRHVRTGYVMDILTKYLTEKNGRIYTNDCTDYRPEISPGDEVSVVETTSRGYFVKRRGISGWYLGELE